MITLVITQILLFLYALLIVWYGQLWRNIKRWVMPEKYSPSVKLSVIIPARNEEENIRHCLDSILEQNYPAHMLEIIVVDDASTDSTASIISGYHHPSLKFIRLQDEKGQAKKRAVAAGIAASTGTLIVTTDADCIFNKNWLLTLAGFYEKKQPACIAAPVCFTENPTALAIFQSLDFLSLQGVTAVSVEHGILNMSNAANFAYERSVYDAVRGFEDIDHLASGDDMLLLQKIAAHYPGRIQYCLSADAIVETKPVSTVMEFLQQRIRWASKARFYKEPMLFYIMLLVYLSNLSLVVLFIHAFFQLFLFYWLIILIVFKFLAEMLFLYPVASFFNRKNHLLYFLPAQPFHILYTVIAGLLGQFGTYTWKGRRLK